jgi:hypothetical protein
MADATVVTPNADPTDPVVPIGGPQDMAASLDSPQEPDETPVVDTPAADATVTDPPLVEQTLEQVQADLAAMRRIAREQRMQFAQQEDTIRQLKEQQKLAAAAAVAPKPKAGGLDDFDDEPAAQAPTKAAEIPPSEFQQLNQQLQQITEVKGPVLETLAETMAMNPAYADLAIVVSKDNFAHIVDEVAAGIAAEHKIPLAEAQLRTEIAIWSKPNPYKYMYDVIKKYHPTYANAPAAAAAGDGKESPAQAAAKAKTPQAAKAPNTIVDVPSADTNLGGWTAARIDALDELKLSTVPQNVYEAYMNGTLK